MTLDWRAALAVVAVLFLVSLVVKLRPVPRRRRELSAEVKAARERAHVAPTPRARAAALCEAARLSLRMPGGHRAGIELLLRAMNADPSWPDPIDSAIGALEGRKPITLERLLWRRLSSVPWNAEHRVTLVAAGAGLRNLYANRLGDPARAEFFARWLADLAAGSPAARSPEPTTDDAPPPRAQ